MFLQLLLTRKLSWLLDLLGGIGVVAEQGLAPASQLLQHIEHVWLQVVSMLRIFLWQRCHICNTVVITGPAAGQILAVHSTPTAETVSSAVPSRLKPTGTPVYCGNVLGSQACCHFYAAWLSNNFNKPTETYSRLFVSGGTSPVPQMPS